MLPLSPEIKQMPDGTKTVDSLRLIADKLEIPPSGSCIKRPRLCEQLAKSLEHFNMTLVAGRAGTGKTALVADFARNSGYEVAWYTVEAADADWEFFSNYFLGCFIKLCDEEKAAEMQDLISRNGDLSVSQMTEAMAICLAMAAEKKSLLIVLDDAHCVFDAEWFTEFFQTLLIALPTNVHLLMLSRSLPALPLWRMRSKQMLGVIDETQLSFTAEETTALFDKYGIPTETAADAQQQSYGRIAKINQFVEQFTESESNFAV